MPSTQELLVFLAAIVAIWIVLKVARMAIKLIFIIVSIAFFIGVLWFVFS
jgi:hypothetical protein